MRYKGILFFLLLSPFSFLLSPLYAQTFSGGLLAGFAITDVSGANTIYPHPTYHKFGIDAGAFVDARISKTSFLQMELKYIQKGSQQPPVVDTNPVASPTATSSTYLGDYYLLRLNYVEVALAFKHNLNFLLNRKHTSRFAIEGGVSFGELISEYYTVESLQTQVDLNSLDVSIFAGIDYNFSQHFSLCARYANSVIPSIVRDNNNDLLYPYYSSWNRGNNLAFTITLNYTFGSSGLSTDENTTPPTPPSSTQDNNQ